MHGAVGSVRSQVWYVFENVRGNARAELDDASGSYWLFGGAVTQPSQPTPATSRSPEPESIATGKDCGGVPISTIDQ